MQDTRYGIRDTGYSNTSVWNQASSLQTLCSVGIFGDSPVNGDFGAFLEHRRDTAPCPYTTLRRGNATSGRSAFRYDFKEDGV